MIRPTSAFSFTRVAVVQLAYHPAIVADLRSPLEDPIFDPKGPDSLLPDPGRRELSEPLQRRLASLRGRIRAAYDDQLLLRVRAILDQCRAWGVRIVVFPEYSIPWEILGGVADAAGEMVVVAGSHTVDQPARRAGLYERLAAPARPPLGASVCPVLHRGRLLALVPKLNPAETERASMRAGDAWAPVDLPEGLPGPMGVLTCLDFLYRESLRYRDLVAAPLAACRFLAVPGLTPAYTLPEFAGKAWDEARRYGRPVLYSEGAEGGGTSIHVDEGRPHELRRFPDHTGHLEPGDEGVIVADVDLGFERSGGSGRHGGARPVVPVAEATLVYRGHPVALAYARWLEEAAPLFARDDDEALDALTARVEQDRELLLNAGALSGAAARGRRMRRLLADLPRVMRVEEIRQFTREVVLPGEALPLADLRVALAGAAADVIFRWLKRRDARAAGFGEVEERLRKAVEHGRRSGAWTSEGVTAFARLRQAFQGAPEDEGEGEEAKKEEERAPKVQVVAPRALEPAALGVQRHEGWVLRFEARPEAMRAHFDEEQIRAAVDLYLLAVADGAVSAAAVGLGREGEAAGRAIAVLHARGEGGWTIWTDAARGVAEPEGEGVAAAVRASGLRVEGLARVTREEAGRAVEALLPRIEGARWIIEARRARKLREVDGEYVEPDVRVDGGERAPILGALDAWLGASEQTALVLGELGMGKSTSLAVWAERRWQGGEGPRPILVNLAGTPATRDAEGMLLEAAGAEATVPNRAALQLLLRRGRALPIFDGFDEMAARLGAGELAGRLVRLLRVVEGGGRLVIASSEHHFPADGQPRTAAEGDLAEALGRSAGVRRLLMQPFDEGQVEALVRQVKQGPGAADEALRRIARTYDLRDLVRRPLLLGMVLATIDQIEPGAAVGTADLYEAYLSRWLEQARGVDSAGLTDAQKVALAESLAEELWRSGQASCTWDELQRSVRARLSEPLPEDAPLGAALVEIQEGAFFVREGEDRYRFAHKSLLEYFFARALVHTVAQRPAEVLSTRPITAEVSAFVGEILRRYEDPRTSAPVKAVQAWLLGWVQGAGQGERPEEARIAAENALRLLLGLERWSGEGSGWIPEEVRRRHEQLLPAVASTRWPLAALEGLDDRVLAEMEDDGRRGAPESGADDLELAADEPAAAAALAAAPAPPPPGAAPARSPAPAPAPAAAAPLATLLSAGAPPPPLAAPAATPSALRTRGASELLAPPPIPIENPFRPGPALTDAAALPGREPVLADLLALVHSRSPAVLRGPRRAGKTSILHLLAARLAPTHHVLHKTLEATDLHTADDLARFLAPSLKPDPAPADALRERLGGDRQSVLLLDEIANLARAEPSVFAWLRAVGQEKTAIVLVGSHWDWVQIVEHAARAPGSSFGNDVTPVNLGSLTEAEALDFLVTTAPSDVPLQRDMTARWIVDICGPWPFYLQVMGYAVVQAVRLGSRRALVEPQGVTELYEQRLLLERDAGFFGTRWAELPERARRILWRLKSSPSADLPAFRDLPPEDRKILRDTGLCDAFGRWLQDRPFYDWIRRIANDPSMSS